MTLVPFLFVAQMALPAQATRPVLSLPEPGIDDPAAYQGYQTRFYRDAAGNTLQTYMEGLSGRVVHLLANADNESVGFSVRSPNGPPRLAWASEDAQVGAVQGFRYLTHHIVAQAQTAHLGAFLLGSMRVERDFQYWKRHLQPFGGPAFLLDEYSRLFAVMERLPGAERARHLAALNATTVGALRARVRPRLRVRSTPRQWVARVTQLSLDGRDSLALEILVDPRRVAPARGGDSLVLRAVSGDSVAFSVRVWSSADALVPLTREQIFTPEFLAFLREARRTSPLLERQARGVELLSSREKLMAGLPAYATYFGRDMLMSALMMRPIWRPEMTEFAVGSVLRKLSPRGEVSHEEALGEQAVREAASEYVSLVERALGPEVSSARRDTLLRRARAVLRDSRRVRENYHMLDDEFQFPILVARWLDDSSVTPQRKRAFLRARERDGSTRLELLLRELALVASMTSAYAAEQTATNLVAFPARDSTRWAAVSWRDSGVGYANGRYAMDINAAYAPHALEALGVILRALPALGFPLDSLARVGALPGPDTPLGRYARDAQAWRAATDAWWGAWRHFEVRLGPDEIRRHVDARLAPLPAVERAHWEAVRAGADRDSLVFMALALDALGRPIGVANTDVATGLFLGGRPGAAPDTAALLRDVRLFVRPFPVGLLIDGVGPVVANDAYATPAVWADFERDRYHGPRVVWGREVNLFALGVAERLRGEPAGPVAAELRAALERVLRASEASGFQSELWSYEVRPTGVVPVRYGTGSDVQLWSTTDLAVQFALSRLRR